MELLFNADTYTKQGKGRDLVCATVELTREYMSGNKSIDFSTKNEGLKKSIIDYACERASIDQSLYDVTNKSDFAQMLDNQTFTNAIFSVVTKAVDTINTKVELNQAYSFINFLSLAEGDSLNQKQEANGIVEFKATGYSNYAQMVHYRFDDNKTMLPERKEAGIAVDLYQMTAYGFNFAKFIADIALGERVAMQQDAILAMMNTTNLMSTAFHLTAFTKADYIELAEKLGAFNGRETIAYGTKGAWGKVADSGIETKFLYGTTGDEIVKTGMVQDLFNVPSVVLDQAITRDGQFKLKVPSDKLVLCPAGQKPITIVNEGQSRVVYDANGDNSIALRTYKVITSWKADFFYNGAIGLVELA